MRQLKQNWLQLLTHLGALLPLALLVWDLAQGQLTVNPIREIQLRTGRYALTLLVLTLACRPVSSLFNLSSLLPLRRLLGLYAFLYASLHFLNFVGLDYGFNLTLIREDIFEKRFALVGFAAFLSLIPLAITSTKGWQKKLGSRWGRLHWLVYLAALLAVTHYVWLAKADIRGPLAYAGVVILLLIIRLLYRKKSGN